MYFDSLEAKEPSNSFATMEIMAVQKSSSDPHQRVFTLVLFKKKKDYRAKNIEERDAWVEALESVSGMKGTGVVPVPVKKESLLAEDDPAAVADTETESKGERESGNIDVKDVDLRALCEQMKKSFSWQIQISKSFSSKDVADFVKKTLSHLTAGQIQEVGQGLIDLKLIIPLKSHVFDVTDSGRFKFVESAAPKQPKNHLNMRGPSIANLMGNDQFNARKYAEDFLRKHSPQKIDSHLRSEFKAIDKKAEERKQSMALDEFIRDLEVYLYERNYEQFTNHMFEYKRKETQGIESATEVQQAKVSYGDRLLYDLLLLVHSS
ncbi:unnamed protein product [Phytophthora lilii]|uniref:Unnamed protein product n=1 Tax=Phytophthora lilii TaxID=2077276 RepID=A0A9W6TBX7_9STRA|nr:unnamed protein product [Phytophthora lilii]